MKRKTYILILLCVLLSVIVAKIYLLNKKYPNPIEEPYIIGETITDEIFSVTLNRMEIIDGNELAKRCPEEIVGYHSDGTPYQGNEIRVLLAEISVEKLKNVTDTFDFSVFMCESNAFGNGVNPSIFMKLNPGVSIQREQINYKEARKVTLPFTMIQEQFRYKKQWERIEEREFFVVYSLYPVKKMFVYKADR